MRDSTATWAPPILCFGEVLWDVLPHGKFPGGAPINVAYHLRRHDRRAVPVTAVGRDELGDELLRRLANWDLETDYVAVVDAAPTGTVEVTIGEGGNASYHIVENVAWDLIEVSSDLLELARRSAALIYGTLAARFAHNREQLETLLGAGADALKIYDVNLRPPYDDYHTVWELARSAHVIKLNHAELIALTGETAADDLRGAALRFAARSECRRVCVTAGERGAGLLIDGAWHWAEARPVKAKDTIGAGDAFLASLVNDLLRNAEDHDYRIAADEMLRRACRLGEFVAANDGATPRYRRTARGEIVTT